jgi:hypothetical protein
MATLLGTLYCASDRRLQALSGHVGPSETSANTPAGTHDGSDATLDAAEEGAPCSLNYVVGYRLAPAAVAGNIEFLRVMIRARASSGGLMQPVLRRIQRGATQAVSAGLAWYQFDFAVDPFTDLPWTNPAIDEQSWGFSISADDVGAGTAAVSELLVEAWGSPAAPPMPQESLSPARLEQSVGQAVSSQVVDDVVLEQRVGDITLTQVVKR